MSNSFLSYLKKRKYFGEIISKDERNKLEPKFEEVFNYIGVFLNLHIIIEQHLDQIISMYMAKNLKGFQGADFKSLILNGNFFNSRSKHDVFAHLSKSTFLFLRLVDRTESEKILTQLKALNTHRNMLAHNQFKIHTTKKTAHFECNKKNKFVDIELKKTEMIKNLEVSNSIIKYLENFYIKLKEFNEKNCH